MPGARPSKIVYALLPLILFYAAFDSGSHKDLPKLGLSTLFMVFAILILLVERDGKTPPLYAVLPFSGLVFFSLITIFWSMSPARTVNEAVYLGGMLGAYIVGTNVRDRDKMLRWLGLLSLSVVVIGYYFFLLPRFGGMNKTHDMQNYFFSTFYWKNPAAAFISIFIPLNLYLIFHSDKRIEKVLWSISLSLHIAAFILTRSRGAWLAFLAGLLAMGIYIFLKRDKYCDLIKRISLKYLLIPLSAAVLIGIILLPRDVQRQSISTSTQTDEQQVTEERSSFERKAMLLLGLDVFRDRPMGTGAGAFIAAYPSYLRNDIYLSKHLHNQYLHYLVETGVIGFLLFFSMMLFIWLSLLRGRSLLSPFILLSFTAFSLHLLLDFHWTFGGITFPLFVLLGIASDNQEGRKVFSIPLSVFFTILSLIGIMSASSIAFRENAFLDEESYGRWMERSAKIFPLNAESRYYLARYYQSIGENERAMELYKAALELEENSSSIHNAFGSFLVSLGDTADGLEHLQESISRAPFSSTANHRRVGEILSAQGMEEDALLVWTEMIERFSRNPHEEYTSNTYSHRYDVGYALRQIASYYKANGKPSDALIKEAERMERPRRKDALAAKVGIETFSPEFIAYQLVEKSLGDEQIKAMGISRAGYDLLNGKAAIEVFYISGTDSLLTRYFNFNAELREGTWNITGGNLR